MTVSSRLKERWHWRLSPTMLAPSKVLKVTFCRTIVMCVLVYSHGWDEIGKPECQQIVSEQSSLRRVNSIVIIIIIIIIIDIIIIIIVCSWSSVTRAALRLVGLLLIYCQQCCPCVTVTSSAVTSVIVLGRWSFAGFYRWWETCDIAGSKNGMLSNVIIY